MVVVYYTGKNNFLQIGKFLIIVIYCNIKFPTINTLQFIVKTSTTNINCHDEICFQIESKMPNHKIFDRISIRVKYFQRDRELKLASLNTTLSYYNINL